MRSRLALSVAGAAALSSSAAAALSLSSPPTSTVGPSAVQLASTVRSAGRATTVLVHGLDSSKETWTGVLADLAACGYPAIALDLRGHGESPLGHPADFSPAALASDVLLAVRAAGIDRCVLIGHSMGGRICMRAAALEVEALDQPSDALAKEQATWSSVLRAVVIEDMDVSHREWNPALTAEEEQQLAGWDVTRGGAGRAFQTWEACRAALLPWYSHDEARVDSWRGKRVRPLPAGTGPLDNKKHDGGGGTGGGRPPESDNGEVEPASFGQARALDQPGAGGGWWTDINPLARRLAWQHVLSTSDGAEAWDALARRAAGGGLPFQVALWYADQPGTVVKDGADDQGGIPDMLRRFPQATARRFPGAAHSVHNTRRQDFVDALKALVDDVS